MPISRIPGVGLDTGSSGVAPSNLSTGGPSWDGSGNLSFNSGYGSVATAYGCRAWVNFNGTGTVAIRASGNVTSITDNGVGNYTVNFTNAMPDANYSAVATGNRTLNTHDAGLVVDANRFNTTNVSISTGLSNFADAPGVFVAIFR